MRSSSNAPALSLRLRRSLLPSPLRGLLAGSLPAHSGTMSTLILRGLGAFSLGFWTASKPKKSSSSTSAAFLSSFLAPVAGIHWQLQEKIKYLVSIGRCCVWN